MFIWKSEFIRMIQRETELSQLHASLNSRITLLEATNLKLQDEIQSLHSNRPAGRDAEYESFDIMAEDEGEVQRLIHEIKRDGRDAVISRER